MQISEPHAGIVGHTSEDPELLRQCIASGQVEADQIALHAGDTTLRLALSSIAHIATQAAENTPPVFDFRGHLVRQRTFSERTFGPGARTAGVLDHIRKELIEIEAAPSDLSEWIDVVILALDGAWRAGHTPDQIITALIAKQSRNEGRAWPNWRTVPADRAIEHDRRHHA